MAGSVPARLIDLTRLVSRVGKGPPTGVDRVEAAWLRHLLTLDVPLFGLVRSAAGFLLLDRGGAQAVADLASGVLAPAAPDLIGRLLLRRDPARAGAEAVLRRRALARCLRPGLAGMLRRHLPRGVSALNLGHANLTAPVLRALHQGPGAQVTVLVHDTIPLDHPRFTRPGTPEDFARKLATVSAHADRVIHTAHATRATTDAHLARLGRVPPGIVAPLGVEVPPDGPLPPDLVLDRPYFVALGTIEPRKNHALLLDVWDDLARAHPAGALPDLLILGRRGWQNRDVFDRLDALRGPDARVRELPGLSDAAVGALLRGARALLFPSQAEGYGLPPLEAAALGVPVIAPPLPVLRELLGDYPVYASPLDRYAWGNYIWTLTQSVGASGAGALSHGRAVRPPPWGDHFKTVLSIA
ncbi:MAG TPA: glycosyltransferase family 1 protein [Paracoccaceae bacterium]|nr:glycosyltransferase family 1 protein [Paracoccaceae bacterium]